MKVTIELNDEEEDFAAKLQLINSANDMQCALYAVKESLRNKLRNSRKYEALPVEAHKALEEMFVEMQEILKGYNLTFIGD